MACSDSKMIWLFIAICQISYAQVSLRTVEPIVNGQIISSGTDLSESDASEMGNAAAEQMGALMASPPVKLLIPSHLPQQSSISSRMVKKFDPRESKMTIPFTDHSQSNWVCFQIPNSILKSNSIVQGRTAGRRVTPRMILPIIPPPLIPLPPPIPLPSPLIPPLPVLPPLPLTAARLRGLTLPARIRMMRNPSLIRARPLRLLRPVIRPAPLRPIRF